MEDESKREELSYLELSFPKHIGHILLRPIIAVSDFIEELGTAMGLEPVSRNPQDKNNLG